MAGQGKVNADLIAKALAWAQANRKDLLAKNVHYTSEGAKALRKAYMESTGGSETDRERKRIDLVGIAKDADGALFVTGQIHDVENVGTAKGFAAQDLRASAAAQGYNVTEFFAVWEKIDHSDVLLPRLAETGDPAVVDTSASTS